MRTRKLRLVKETLSALDTGELRLVAGGNSQLPCLLESQYTYTYTYCVDCVNDVSLEFCPTLPVEHCL